MIEKKRTLRSLIIVVALFSFVLINSMAFVKLVDAVSVEAGSDPPDIAKFFLEEQPDAYYVTDMSTIPMDVPGIYEIKVQVGKKEYSSKLEIKDTVAPAAEVVDYEIWPEELKEATDFVKNVVDVTDVKVYFQEQPDYSKAGTQEVPIILEDTSGNKTVLKASLTIKTDTEAPVITGAKDQTIFVGEKISYKKDVTVTDNRDEDIELLIDSSAVNLKKTGDYQVIYRAIDLAGNEASTTVTIHIKEKPKNYVDPEELNQLADRVLSSIIKDGMSDIEKLWAIYKWTNKSISYTGSSDKSSWLQGAMRGLKQGTGDCFNYYATSRILLTRAGFENQSVTRVGGKTQHFWNLVYIGGGWYHFDASPHNINQPFVSFLRTDSELEEYTKKVKDYYKFDKSKYPSTPIEPLKERSKYVR